MTEQTSAPTLRAAAQATLDTAVPALPSLLGAWVAVPQAHLDALRAALAAAPQEGPRPDYMLRGILGNLLAHVEWPVGEFRVAWGTKKVLGLIQRDDYDAILRLLDATAPREACDCGATDWTWMNRAPDTGRLTCSTCRPDFYGAPHEPSPDGPSEVAIEAAIHAYHDVPASRHPTPNEWVTFLTAAISAAYAVDFGASRGATGEGHE